MTTTGRRLESNPFLRSDETLFLRGEPFAEIAPAAGRDIGRAGEDEEFELFKQGIAEIETGGLTDRNVRTGAQHEGGSAAFGMYQTTLGKVKDMLALSGVTYKDWEESTGRRGKYGKRLLDFKYSKDADKGVYTKPQVESLKRLAESQFESLRLGGKEDREKQKALYNIPEEYLDAYDYSDLSQPSRGTFRGTLDGEPFGLTEEDLSNLPEAQEIDLKRHFRKYRDSGDSLVEIARKWHGGPRYAFKKVGSELTELTEQEKKDSPNYKRTLNYGDKFRKLVRDRSDKLHPEEEKKSLTDRAVQFFESFIPEFQDGGLVDPGSGFDFMPAQGVVEEEDYDLYETPGGRLFGVPIGTSRQDASRVGLNFFRDDYISAMRTLERQPESDIQIEKDPGLVERFGGELAAAFREQMTSVPGAFKMTLGDILNDEELYRSGLSDAEESSKKSSELAPFARVGLKSGEENVLKTFEEEGFFPAAYKSAELVAQTLGQTIGFAAPAAFARMATGALAASTVATLPVTGSIAGVALLGGAAFLTYSNLLSNQLERNAQVARREGREPDTEDFNIANQMIAAAGQTALESLVPAAVARGLPRGATGLKSKRLEKAILDAGQNTAVRNASNTAAAKTVLNAAKTSSGSRALQVAGTMGIEGVTEVGQSLIERAAAGETIDFGEQEVLDEAVESFAAGMIGGSLFGATGQAIDYRKEREAQRKRNEEKDKEDVELEEQEESIEESVEDASPESAKTIEARRILEQNAKDAPRLQAIESLQGNLSREAQLGVDTLNEEADAEARRKAQSLLVQDRTKEDVLNVARSRNIDIDSSNSASSGFSRFVFDVTKRSKGRGEKAVFSLDEATPRQVELIYSSLENLPSQTESTSLPSTSVSESIEIASKIKRKLAGNKTKKQLVNLAKAEVSKRLGKNAPDSLIKDTSVRLVDNLISNGVVNPVVLDAPTVRKRIAFVGEVDFYESGEVAQSFPPLTKKPRKKKIRRYSLNPKADIESLIDSDFRDVSGAILSLAKANQSTVKDSDNSVKNVAGAYPSYRAASRALTGLDKKTYDKSKILHQELGLVTKGKSPKVITRENAPVNRISFEADQVPYTRWVIRDQNGSFVRAEPSKAKSNKFIQGNQDKNLAAPQRERGYAVREVQYGEGPTGQETVSQSRVVNFIPTDVYEETVKPSKFVTNEEAHDAAMSQRGEPESVMREITVQNNPGFPAKMTDLLMHVGDLSHRAQEMNGIGILPLTEKINYILRHDHSFNRATIREEIEQGRVSNAKYNLLNKIPEFVRLDRGRDVNGDPAWEAAGYKTRSEFFNDFLKNISEAEIQQEIQRGRDAEVEPLAEYISAHQNYNNPVTEMGQLGKEMAIDLAEGKYEVVYEKAKEIRSFLDKYADLESQGKEAQAEKLRLRRAKTPATKPLLRSMQGSDIAFDAQLDAQIDARERADALAESVTRYFGTNQEQGPNVTPRLLRAINATRTKRKKGLKEATQILRDSPFSLPNVVKSYAMSVAQGSSAFETVQESDNWNMPFDAASKGTAKATPVKVKEGTILRTNGRGFGRQKLQVRSGQISRSTPFSNYLEALNAFFDRLSNNPNILKTPEISVFANGPGRSVAIWNNPSFNDPLTIVMDYVEDSESGNYFSVFDMIPGDEFGSQVEEAQIKRNLPPKRGRNVSTQAVLAAEDPDNAKRLSGGEREAQSIEISSIEKEAEGLTRVTAKEKKGIVGYINKVFETFIGPDMLSSIQRQAFDKWDRWVLAEQTVANKALGRQMFADQSAVSMARNIENLFPMFTESLSKGFVRYVDGVLTIEKMDLDNNTGDTPIRYFDPESRVFKTGKFSVRNMFSELEDNDQGGFVTILTALQDSSKNLIGSLFDYTTALRSYRIIKSNEGKPRKEHVKTPYDGKIQLLKEHLSIPFYEPRVAVAHHNLQKWNSNTVEFLVDTGVLDREEANFWLENSDYIPFYINLNNETNRLLEREWNSFQAKRGKKGRVYNNLTFNDPSTPLEKGSSEIADPMESYLKNAMGALTAGAVTVARGRAIRNALANGTATRVERGDPSDPNVVSVREKGQDIFFRVDDAVELELSAMVEADPLSDLLETQLIKTIFANPASWLRESVTRDPSFALANLIRDSMIVWMINPSLGGQTGLGLVGSAIKRAIGTSENEQRQALRESGMVRGPKSGSTMMDSNYYLVNKSKKSAEEIRGKIEGEKPNSPIMSLWNALGDLSNRSEMATREIVYEHVFTTTRDRLKSNQANEQLPDETNSQFEDRITRIAQAEGVEQAREILNFNRRGSNIYLQKFLSVTPFMNASMQGLNVMFRGFTGFRPVGIDREAGPDVVFNSIARRGAKVAAASVALELLNLAGEDEEYSDQSEHIKNNYFLIPMPTGYGFVAIPTPFEYGFIFKVIPQLMTRAVVDQFSGDLEDNQSSIMKSSLAAASTAVPIVPPMLKLAESYLTNRTSFGDLPIDYDYERQTEVPAERRVRAGTTAQSQIIGQVVGPMGRFFGMENLSPNFIDSAVRTLAGGLAVDAWNSIDFLLRTPSIVSSSYPYRNRPVPRIENLPLLDRFYQDETGSGQLSPFYDYRKEILRVEREIRSLYEEGRHERVRQLMEDNEELLALSRPSQKVYSYLKEIGAEIRDIKSGESELGPLEARDRIKELEMLRRDPLRYWRAQLAQFRNAQ